MKQIVHVQNDFTKLDSCIFKLYNAENSCRMYVVSGDRNYYNLFTQEIKEIALIMDAIETQNQKEKALSPETFDNLIQQKKVRTAQFIQLKQLSDSLINFSINVDKNREIINPDNKLFSTRQFKSIIKIDTLRPSITAQPKKKFFGRIFAAINDNKLKGTDSSKSTLVKTVISADTSSISVAYNKLQLKAINSYYLRLYKTNQKLKDKERQLLDVNHQLITTIVGGLTKYKLKEKEYFSSVQSLVSDATIISINNLDTFTWILLALATGLLLIVFFIIYNFYKNELSLIEYSNKASLYALSKSRFLANMSHEIRTPLNSIVGFSEQLTQIKLPAEQSDQVGAIRNSSIMLLDVVNDILDFSKYETGKVTLEQIPFSPYTAISNVFNSMKIQADIKHISFDLNLKFDEHINVEGDQLRLKQVVMNLLSNAIKFTTSGKVVLDATLSKQNEKNGILTVSISDTGVGIKQLDQKIIFDEFAQVYYSSTKEKQQGTGLGLAICKKIIEFQGGNINVKSEENKGSVFTFTLPYEFTDKAVKVIDSGQIVASQAALLEGKYILLADDNKLNIMLAGTILKKYKIKFDAAYDGKKALSLFSEHTYDLVLTDIQMPEMGGIELTRNIRNHVENKKRNIPILGVTANVMQEDRVKYLASGMNELVLKPFLEKELLEKIISFLK